MTKAKDLRKKSLLELRTEISELQREILNLRFQSVNAKLASPVRIRSSRRSIARIKTVIAQRVKE